MRKICIKPKTTIKINNEQKLMMTTLQSLHTIKRSFREIKRDDQPL